jgi:hypothetical protein
MSPAWLTAVAWVYLSLCFCCAGIVSYDIVFNRRRQPMGVMNLVFPITALYFGPFALLFYWRWGRVASRLATSPMPMPRPMPMAMPLSTTSPGVTAVTSTGDSSRTHNGDDADHDAADEPASGIVGVGQAVRRGERDRPWWVSMAIEVSHCGSGCALGDVISEFAIFWLALTIASTTLLSEYTGDYVLALAFGILFQYFAIAPLRGLGLRDGLKAAAKADFLSLTAFEVGLFGWMAIMSLVLFPAPHQLTPSSAAFWLLMQVGMIIGYFTSWPANVWLVKRGIKIPM